MAQGGDGQRCGERECDERGRAGSEARKERGQAQGASWLRKASAERATQRQGREGTCGMPPESAITVRPATVREASVASSSVAFWSAAGERTCAACAGIEAGR